MTMPFLLKNRMVTTTKHTLREKKHLFTAITSTSVLKGAGGYGKTTLAQALCYDTDIQAAFDRIEWITLGETVKESAIVEKIRSLLHRLGHTSAPIESMETAKAALKEALKNRRLLLVIDDVWYKSQLTPFLIDELNCVRVITTRNEGVLPPEIVCVSVGAMTPEEAVQILCYGLGTVEYIQQHERTFYELVRILKHWPLLLGLANGILRKYMKRYGQTLPHGLSYLQEALERHGLIAFDDPHSEERHDAVSRTLDISLSLLEHEEYARYLQFAIFPENALIPLKEIRRLWPAADEISEFEAKKLCMHFSELSLLRSYDLNEDQARLHDSIRAYLRIKVGDSQLAIIQRQFLKMYQVTRYADLTIHEVYAWTHLLPTHLVESQQPELLLQTITDLRYLAKKIHVHKSVYAAEVEIKLVQRELAKQMEGMITLLPLLDILWLELARLNNLLHMCKTVQETECILLCYLYHSQEISSLCQLLQQELSYPVFLPWHPLPTTTSTFLIRTLQGHAGPVTDCAISHDGKWIVSGSADTTLKMWNAETGELRFTMEGHRTSVTSCAINALGTRVISTAEDGTIKIWNAFTGNELLSLEGHPNRVTDCVISSDSNWIVTASADTTLKIWDIHSINEFPPIQAYQGAVICTLQGHEDAVTSCAISPDDSWITSVSAGDKTLRIWESHTGNHRILADTLKDGSSEMDCAISHDGTFIVTAFGIQLDVWDIAERKKRDFQAGGHSGGICGCAISSDGSWMLSASTDTTLKGWRTDTGTDIFLLEDHADSVNACAISPADDWIVSASEDHTLKIWQVPEITQERMRAEEEYWFGFYSCTISSSGDWAAVVSIADQVKLYDTGTGKEIGTLGDWAVTSTRCAISPDDTWVLSTSDYQTLTAWDAQTGEERFTCTVDTGKILCCAISPDGGWIVSGGEDHQLKVWDSCTGTERLTLSSHGGNVNSCAISPDGSWIVSASDDHTLKIWDAPSGTELRTFHGHTDKVNDCAILIPDKMIISASNDGTVQVWQAEVSTEPLFILQHDAAVKRCVITPDKTMLVTLTDKQLRLWDLQTRACLSTFYARNTLFDCAFHPDGRHLILAADDDLYFLKMMLSF